MSDSELQFDGELTLGEPLAQYSPLSRPLTKERGTVQRCVFASDDGNYCVLRVLGEDGHTEMVFTGALSGVCEGQDLEAEGHWEKHPKHGRQFRVESYHSVLPRTADGIARYLASGILPGIGLTFAKRIVEHFGDKTLDVLDHYSEKLREVPGVGKKRLNEIRQAWHQSQGERESLIFLQSLGITPAYCRRILDKYGKDAAPEIVSKNPYRLASDINGIGFQIADRIASHSLNISKDAPIRLCAGAVYALEELSARGNTCYPVEKLVEEAAAMLGVGQTEARSGIETARREGKLFIQSFPQLNQGQEYAYLQQLLQSELTVAVTVRNLAACRPTPVAMSPSLPLEPTIRLNQEQAEAVRQAFATCCSIITGGPGVGKTTVVSQIVRQAQSARLHLALAAPTGRAAKRLAEATGEAAQTIHRLLKWDAKSKHFLHNADNPLVCDLLIVDECSMLDINLAASLFQAIRPGARLVLVGDNDQLPSVGPGTVLQDLISSRLMPVTRLTQIYRQGAGSRIIVNAHAVNQGRSPDLSPLPPGVKGDFYWVEQDDPEKITSLFGRMISERIPAVFGFDPVADVQILSPMRKGQCGTATLNETMQELLNPPASGKAEFVWYGRKFRVGDKVMQITNNYDKEVFNGEMGRIVAIDTEGQTFQVDFEQNVLQYDWNEAEQLVLAYAVTVHKSQGSEFPVVIMPVLTQHFIMLQRNLVYTGMTRARKLLIMVGSRRALEIAIRNNEPVKRMSLLRYRLTAR